MNKDEVIVALQVGSVLSIFALFLALVLYWFI